jgi:hypothetical protein
MAINFGDIERRLKLFPAAVLAASGSRGIISVLRVIYVRDTPKVYNKCKKRFWFMAGLFKKIASICVLDS